MAVYVILEKYKKKSTYIKYFSKTSSTISYYEMSNQYQKLSKKSSLLIVLTTSFPSSNLQGCLSPSVPNLNYSHCFGLPSALVYNAFLNFPSPVVHSLEFI